uniref:CDC48_N domain-containing protein n=1 Tax=Ascaris lumbricoides TaxID=6252 RepID=A0A0M3HM03_ASCLU
MCGSQELPRDAKTKVVSSEIGLVSGDRLRLVIGDKPFKP